MSIFAFKIAAKLHKNPEISLIICTHNRAAKLREALPYYAQLTGEIPFEIIVVLNACSDDSLSIVEAQKIDNLRYVVEPTIGHSNARNAGYKAANSPFVFYIDDDAYPASNLIEELFILLQKEELICISGRTVYWKSTSPNWITGDLVEVPKFLNSFGLLPEGNYINGCACGFNTKALEQVGGFNPDIGMKGKNLGYFDEVYVQEKLQDAGFRIHYSPQLIVHHQSHIQTVGGFLKAAYIKGKSRSNFKQISTISSIAGFIKSLVRGVFTFLASLFVMPGKTAMVRSFTTPFVYLGQLIR